MMKKFELKGSQKEPKLVLDLRNGSIKILGRSTMVNPHDFYSSVLKLVDDYCKQPLKKSFLMIDLEYYNTLTVKYLLRITELMSKINLKEGYEIKMNWYFEAEDIGIAEDIKLISEIIQFKINAIEHEYEFA